MDKIGEPQPLTPEREQEIRKQNKLNQSWAVRDLLHEVERLRELTERPCTDDEPCECCRINTELTESLIPAEGAASGILDILQSGVTDRAEYWEKRSREVEETMLETAAERDEALRDMRYEEKARAEAEKRAEEMQHERDEYVDDRNAWKAEVARLTELKEAALRQLAEAQKERDVARGVENLERIRADKATWACEQLEARLKDDDDG